MTTTTITDSVARLGVSAAQPIQAGSRLTEVLVNNELLRVVMFTLDAGQELTEHGTPRAVVVTIIEGALDFTVEGRTSHMVAGDVLYMAPGARHSVVVTEPSRMQLVLVEAPGVSEAEDTSPATAAVERG